ncbi:MAG: hypothetical protein MUF44_04305 [Hydrogenophaga sp.]|jgi:hypothetical protein|nr:hypothetical protein [Hydrogenophaga sp.]
MLTLETLLPADELANFNALIAEATSADASAISWHSPTSAVVVIGFCQAGQLLTWFATPAINEMEVVAARSVILLGVAQAAHTVAALQSGAYEATAEVIKRARH